MDNLVRRFDWYRRVPKDLTESSVHGAVVSILTITVALYLFLSNLSEFLTVQTRSEMFVDDFHQNIEDSSRNKLRINLDIKFPRVPCAALALDAQDVMGSHELSTGGLLFKLQLGRDGNTVLNREEVHGNHMTESKFHGLSRHNWNILHQHDKDHIKEELLAQEGCRLQGSLEVNRVPGNIHISTHYLGGFPTLSLDDDGMFGRGPSFGSSSNKQKGGKENDVRWEDLSTEQKYQRLQNLDLEHEILHLSFGDDRDLQWVVDNFQNAGILSPLDGVKQTCERKKYDPNSYHGGLFNLPGLDGPSLFNSDQTAKLHDPGAAKVPSGSTSVSGNKNGEGSSSSSTIDLVNTVAQPTIFEYYCNVVPTRYEKLGASSRNGNRGGGSSYGAASGSDGPQDDTRRRDVYQFTSNQNELKNTHAPGIYIRYGIAPVAVKFVEHRIAFFTFFVQTLAILGGLFTVAGLVESVLHTGLQSVQRKFELGKLT
ncbi:unnamed protein product [Amoebophrya sp. A120]|nr:unnamed protein product [Amoebophrya sp. A120]|eukprot:GSA120T00016769001.1